MTKEKGGFFNKCCKIIAKLWRSNMVFFGQKTDYTRHASFSVEAPHVIICSNKQFYFIGSRELDTQKAPQSHLLAVSVPKSCISAAWGEPRTCAFSLASRHVSVLLWMVLSPTFSKTSRSADVRSLMPAITIAPNVLCPLPWYKKT